MKELQKCINKIMEKVNHHDPQIIGARVMAFRELIGASRDELAKSLNVSSADLQDIENGEIHDDVFFPIVKKLVNEYGINSDWLNFGNGAALSQKGPNTPEGIFQFMQRLEQKKTGALILTFIINPIIDDVYAEILAAQRSLKTGLFSKKPREFKG